MRKSSTRPVNQGATRRLPRPRNTSVHINAACQISNPAKKHKRHIKIRKPTKVGNPSNNEKAEHAFKMKSLLLKMEQLEKKLADLEANYKPVSGGSSGIDNGFGFSNEDKKSLNNFLEQLALTRKKLDKRKSQLKGEEGLNPISSFNKEEKIERELRIFEPDDSELDLFSSSIDLDDLDLEDILCKVNSESFCNVLRQAKEYLATEKLLIANTPREIQNNFKLNLRLENEVNENNLKDQTISKKIIDNEDRKRKEEEEEKQRAERKRKDEEEEKQRTERNRKEEEEEKQITERMRKEEEERQRIEIKRIEEEERQRIERKRKEEEEKQRIEIKRIEEEERQRIERKRKEEEERQRIERKRKEEEERQRKEKIEEIKRIEKAEERRKRNEEEKRMKEQVEEERRKGKREAEKRMETLERGRRQNDYGTKSNTSKFYFAVEEGNSESSSNIDLTSSSMNCSTNASSDDDYDTAAFNAEIINAQTWNYKTLLHQNKKKYCQKCLDKSYGCEKPYKKCSLTNYLQPSCSDTSSTLALSNYESERAMKKQNLNCSAKEYYPKKQNMWDEKTCPCFCDKCKETKKDNNEYKSPMKFNISKTTKQNGRPLEMKECAIIDDNNEYKSPMKFNISKTTKQNGRPLEMKECAIIDDKVKIKFEKHEDQKKLKQNFLPTNEKVKIKHDFGVKRKIRKVENTFSRSEKIIDTVDRHVSTNDCKREALKSMHFANDNLTGMSDELKSLLGYLKTLNQYPQSNKESLYINSNEEIKKLVDHLILGNIREKQRNTIAKRKYHNKSESSIQKHEVKKVMMNIVEMYFGETSSENCETSTDDNMSTNRDYLDSSESNLTDVYSTERRQGENFTISTQTDVH